MAAATDLLRLWSEEAEAIIKSIFRDSGADQARARLLSEGRQIRLRADAAAQLDDFSYVVRTRFPYPLAFRWRVVDAAVSENAGIDAYQAVLETAEVLLCFCAEIGMAVAQNTGVELQSANQLAEKLKTGRTGPSLGDWVAILEEIAHGRSCRSVDQESVLGHLKALRSDEPSRLAIQRLATKRNDHAHLRRTGDFARNLEEAHADLESLYRTSTFFTELPLIQFTRVTWNTLRRYASVTYREFTGDHAIVPLQTGIYRGELLEQEALYIRDGEKQFHLLRPFLLGRTCPSCGHWSTFHVDRALSKATQLKSLEHGHIIDDPEIHDDLRAVGLL